MFDKICEFLGSVPLFSRLKAREIRYIAEIAGIVSYPPNTTIFHEGESGGSLYIVIEGQLEILKGQPDTEERILRVCGEGEHIGEMSLFNPGKARSATVRTRTAVKLLRILSDDFEALVHRRPAISLSLSSGLAERMLDSESRLMGIIEKMSRKIGSSRDAGQSDSANPAAKNSKNPEKSVGTGIPRLQIKTFGNFNVFRGETLIGEESWKAKQPKTLLKTIVARGGAGIPKDVLIEDLWPEVSSDAGENNFRVVLHRLRRALEPAITHARGSSYLFFKSNLIFLNKELCEIDVDDFVILYQKGKKAEQAGDIPRALRCYRSAIDLYVGDFLAEELYSAWAEAKRNELRLSHLDLLSRAADLYQAQGSSKKAIELYKAMIRADSVCEEAYQKLMQLYLNRGNPAEAVKVYEQCKKNLETDLGVEPSNLTVSMRRMISEFK